MQNYKLGREVTNRAELEKSVQKAKDHTGLQCNLRRRRRRSVGGLGSQWADFHEI
jgi:hypothetical protein